MNYTQLTLSSCFLVFGLSTQAQQTPITSGGEASGGGTVSYSIGQVFFTTNTNSSANVSQGIQQAYTISILTDLNENQGINLFVSAYPNPTTDYLVLNVSNSDTSKLMYQLLDLNGKLLITQKIESNETSIVMNNLLPATYFVIVTENNKEVKSFKITKN